MKRKDWIFLAVAFLLLNGTGLWRGLWLYEQSLSRELADPKLVEMPLEDAVLSGREALKWRWDQPVISDSEVGTAPPLAPVTFSPEVGGDFVWINDRTLQFTPNAPWSPGQAFHTDLETTVTNLQGRVSLTRHHARLQGPPLQFLGGRLMHVEGNQTMEISLRFNQEVHPDDLRKHLRVTDRHGESVSVRLRETPVFGEVFVSADLGGGAPLRLSLASGLTSIHGPRGPLQHEQTFSMDLPTRFHLLDMQPEMPTFEPGSIRLRFHTAPDLASLREHLRIEPEVRFSIGNARWFRRDEVVITGDFQPDQRYTVRLGQGVRGQNHRSLDREIESAVIFPKKSPGLKFSHGGEILNAAGSQQVQVEVENEGQLTLSLRRVQDHNLVELLMRKSGQDHYFAQQSPERSLSVPVWREEMELTESGAVTLDLTEALAEAGQGVYRLSVRGRNSKHSINRLVVNGELGLLTRRHQNELLVWVVGLGDGQPVADAEVQVWSSTRELLAEGRSDDEGTLRLPIPKRTGMEAMALVARNGDRLGVLSMEQAVEFPAENPGRAYLREGHEAFLYTDRGMYRPGETVHFRAIVRGNDFRLPGEFPVQVTLRGPDQLVRHREILPLNDLGTLTQEVTLEADWPNGTYTFALSLPGEKAPEMGRTQVNLESFVPPQIVVDATTPENDEHLPPNFLLKTHSRMLYGGPAADHAVEVSLSVSPETFRSSEHPRHTFSDARKESFSRFTRTIARARTAENGGADFRVEIPDHLQGPSALRAMVGISVREFSGRPAATYISRRIDRHPHYLGLHARAGDGREAELDVVMVTPDGRAVSESHEVTLITSRVNWTSGYRQDANDRWTWFSERVSLEEERETVRLENGRGVFKVRPPADGQWEFAVQHPESQSTSVELSLGSGFGAPPRANRVAMSFERADYRPGEMAKLSVNAPFAGTALLTVETDRIWSQQLVSVPEGDHELLVEVPDPGAANVWVRLSLVRPLPGRGESPVMLAEGAVPLHLQLGDRDLPLRVEAPARLRPGETVAITLRGEPGAEVVLAGVDEGILLLNDFQTPNPFAFFASLRRYAGRQWDLFALLMPELGDQFQYGDPEMGGGADMLRNRINPVDAKRFKPLAWWSGTQRFPASGELQVDMPMPEFTGQIRWMAVQAGRNGVGSAEARSQVARPVVTQQSLPLFLAPGDETDWLVRLHNRSDRDAEIEVRLEAEGPVREISGATESVKLVAGEATILRRRVVAGDEAGVARFRVRFAQGEEAWTDEIELAVRPVHPYRVHERFAVLNPGESLEMKPEDSVHAFHATRALRASAFPALELSGAAGYLLRYPYGCLEQTVSAGMPALFVPDLVGDHVQGGADEIVRATVQRLWTMQVNQGGFAYWPGQSNANFSGTLHALDFLLEAKVRGHEVEAERLQRALDWMRSELNRANWSAENPFANARIAGAARALALGGELDRGWVQRLRERREDFDARGRLLAAEAMIAVGERPLATEMLLGMRAIPGKGQAWYSEISLNAELLRVLLRLNPADERIPRLAEQILEARRNGRWGHTFENATSLRAMSAYHAAFGRERAPLELRWADGSALAEDTQLDLGLDFVGILRNHGTEAVYLRELLGGVPREAPEIENAFTIRQRILDTTGQPLEGPLPSGQNVLLHVKLSGLKTSVEYLAVDLRLPAGLEPLSLNLHRRMHEVVAFQAVRNQFDGANLELRDDRILLFPPVLRGQEAEWYFLLRTVTPGTFTLPAAFAQAMYDPDFEARSEEGRLVVLP
ncbi:MAG: hypothetical protein JJU29_06385 [Verrucomicrobia bacterium]|nr:hypothetical protein [Verrucomicrobiota bacterium]MCH8511495.1 hypothetical protein [Kiritimatiellia bacterium]